MALYSVRARLFSHHSRELTPINWRRGRFRIGDYPVQVPDNRLRIWLLLSAAWVMAWAIDLLLWALRFEMDRGGGRCDSGSFLWPSLGVAHFRNRGELGIPRLQDRRRFRQRVGGCSPPTMRWIKPRTVCCPTSQMKYI
jgi:hypothetical protein